MTSSDTNLGEIFIRTGDLENPPRLFVMGDSHSLFFAGVEEMREGHSIVPSAHKGVRVYYLGPGLAYSLIKPHSRNRTREKIMMALEEVKNAPCKKILFAFGEIDCRYHIRQRAGLMTGGATAENINHVTRITVLRYLAFLLEIKMQGLEPMVWAPICSTSHAADLHQWITLGSNQERNHLTRDFITTLQKEAAPQLIPVLSIFDQLVDGQLNTRPEFSSDAVHLSQRYWEMVSARLKNEGIAF